MFSRMWRAAAESPGERSLEPKLVWLVLVFSTLLAAALRLPFLDHQSLWLDEIFTRDIVGELTLSGLWHHVQSTESTPPLYYLITWLFGGRSAAAMRTIPALALIATVPTLPGFRAERAFRLHAFWGILVGAKRPAPLTSAEFPSSTLFPAR
jgi:hypothetical protein